MSRHFPGLLKNPTEPASGLRVTLVVSGDTVEIDSNNGSLGRWKCSEIEAARSHGNWFSVRVDHEDWEFLPDAPTEFLFYAIPHMRENATRRRRWKPEIQVSASDVLHLGRVVLGGVLAVFVLSIGMLMGRYRWDNSSLTVLVVLVAAAILGGWWTAIQSGNRRESGGRNQARAPVLPPDLGRSALRVRDVIASTQTDGTDHAARTSVSGAPPSDVRGSQVAGRDDISEGFIVPEVTEKDRDEIRSVAHDDFEHGSKLSGDDEIEDIGADVHNDVAPVANDESALDEGRTEFLIDGPSEDDLDSVSVHTAGSFDSRGDTELFIDSRLGGPPVPMTHENGSAPATADLVSSNQAGVDGTFSVADADEGPAKRLSSDRDQSTSVADLLASTADLDQPLELDIRLSEGAKHAPPIDLTTIQGIGPTISAALIQLGVSDVRHLAMLNSGDVAYLERRLGRFATRKRTSRWIVQAQSLVAHEDLQSA